MGVYHCPKCGHEAQYLRRGGGRRRRRRKLGLPVPRQPAHRPRGPGWRATEGTPIAAGEQRDGAGLRGAGKAIHRRRNRLTFRPLLAVHGDSRRRVIRPCELPEISKILKFATAPRFFSGPIPHSPSRRRGTAISGDNSPKKKHYSCDGGRLSPSQMLCGWHPQIPHLGSVSQKKGLHGKSTPWHHLVIGRRDKRRAAKA